MKRILTVLILVVGLLLMAGCGSIKLNDLPDGAIDFTMGTYSDPDHAGDEYGTIVYDGREYVLYGTQRKTVKDSAIDKCIGYLEGDSDERVYTLSETDDYIATYRVNGVMEQFSFWRALDTAGAEVETPNYIIDLGYDLWK